MLESSRYDCRKSSIFHSVHIRTLNVVSTRQFEDLNWLTIGMIKLYTKVRRSRSSAIDGINLGSPADVPELLKRRRKQRR